MTLQSLAAFRECSGILWMSCRDSDLRFSVLCRIIPTQCGFVVLNPLLWSVKETSLFCSWLFILWSYVWPSAVAPASHVGLAFPRRCLLWLLLGAKLNSHLGPVSFLPKVPPHIRLSGPASAWCLRAPSSNLQKPCLRVAFTSKKQPRRKPEHLSLIPARMFGFNSLHSVFTCCYSLDLAMFGVFGVVLPFWKFYFHSLSIKEHWTGL